MKELKLNLKPMIKKLEIFSRKDTISELSGSYRSVFKGKGLDFEGYRKYFLEDDSKDIDWRASLRSPDLLVKIMNEERNLRVFFLFDVSDSMLFSSVDKLKCEYAAETIASLCFAILRAGDSAGMVMFSDRIVSMLPPKAGTAHYYEIIKSLSNPELYGGKFDFTKVLKFLNSYLPRNSVVIVVSDFIGLDKLWMPYFKIATRKFDYLLTIMVRDPVDDSFPLDTGQAVIEDPFSSSKLVIDPNLIKREYDDTSRRIKENIISEFLKLKCSTIELVTDKPFEKKLTRFFMEAKGKWR
jgi:uncharacterized protein (DUF58 family)